MKIEYKMKEQFQEIYNTSREVEALLRGLETKLQNNKK